MALGKSVSAMQPGVADYAAYTIQQAEAYIGPITVTSVNRSFQKQTELRNAYEAAIADGTFGQPGGLQYPANAPGDSAHQYGLAFDSVPDDPAQTDNWIAIRKYFGWRVPDNDAVHAELPNWRVAVEQFGLAPF
jgi:D-alanyl-D-alanine carboxypeptidase